MIRWRQLLPLFVFGALVLSFFDGFHTHSQTTAYAEPWVLMMAWWVPLLFGCALAIGGTIFTVLYGLFGGRARPAPVAIAVGFFVFGALYWVSAYLPAESPVKAGVLLAGATGLWLALDRSWQGVALALITAVCGSLFEIGLSHTGAFWYLRPDHLGVPIWLPALYMASASPVGHLSVRVLRAPAT